MTLLHCAVRPQAQVETIGSLAQCVLLKCALTWLYCERVTSSHLVALGPAVLDPQHLAISLGLIGVLAIIFAECGLLVGFFLPGDSLLFAVGLLTSGGIASAHIDHPLWFVIALISVAAIAGNLCGYYIGLKTGPAVFSRPQSRFFKPEYVTRSEEFFERYGRAALILARFTPIVRTIIPVMAGTAKMNFKKFALFSTVGGIAWAASMTTLGFYLGKITWVQKNLDIIAIGIVAISFIPVWLELRKPRNNEPLS